MDYFATHRSEFWQIVQLVQNDLRNGRVRNVVVMFPLKTKDSDLAKAFWSSSGQDFESPQRREYLATLEKMPEVEEITVQPEGEILFLLARWHWSILGPNNSKGIVFNPKMGWIVIPSDINTEDWIGATDRGHSQSIVRPMDGNWFLYRIED